MILTLALCLDAALGEPKWLWDRLPHPAVLIGRAIGWADTRFNAGANRRTKGIALAAALVIGSLLIGAVIAALGWLPEVLVTAILLAQRSLSDHVRAVASALRVSIADGRRAVARIVGRDTQGMTSAAISRAAVESAAENLSDGVIAPVFWFVVGGLPAMLAYKAINTADSMIGHRTPRHEDFGWASARLDDLLNLIPARLTALLIGLTSGSWPDWRAIARDAALHRSPNAGWPEAAMARALDIALSGPRAYHGQMQDLPWIHATGDRNASADDIDRAATMLWRVWGVVLALAVLSLPF